jgi:hypothetical protein
VEVRGLFHALVTICPRKDSRKLDISQSKSGKEKNPTHARHQTLAYPAYIETLYLVLPVQNYGKSEHTKLSTSLMYKQIKSTDIPKWVHSLKLTPD